MIPAEVEIEPGGGLVELPYAGRNTSRKHLIETVDRCPPSVGSEPHALTVRIDLAPAVSAPPAGAVSDMLGAFRLRAEKSHMLYAAVAALPAIQQQSLNRPFQHPGQRAPIRAPVQPFTDIRQ